jgi:aminopeptidase N
VLLLTGCTPEPAQPEPTRSPTADAGAFAPGGDGLGDSYYPTAGNGGYDVANYHLDLRYDPGTDTISGVANITAHATANLSRFNLDLRGLTVERAEVDGAPANTAVSGDELIVTPPHGIAKGSQFVLTVSYRGVPRGYVDGLGSVGFLHTDDGAVAIGEPEVAASWFPVNDHPRDKATYTIAIEAPDGLTALANGVLKGKESTGELTTWTWQETSPMAPYLATVVIGDFRVQQSTHDGKQVVTAVASSLPTDVDQQLARTPAVVDFLEQWFGPYPFDAIGGIVIDDDRIRFALENQSRPIYSDAFFAGGQDGVWVIVHELAHQWYGNSVSVHDWREIWLNEGFASYAEWLWFEKRGGRSAQANFERFYGNAGSAIWEVPPGDPGRRDLFHQSVYTRGAMALHALRVTVGDTAFFEILRTWAAEKADKNATTAEFITLAERISRRQLDDLFKDWLYERGRPPRPRP